MHIDLSIINNSSIYTQNLTTTTANTSQFISGAFSINSNSQTITIGQRTFDLHTLGELLHTLLQSHPEILV